MPSFVSNLRMNNMFPIKSGLGNAKIDLSGRDPLREIISIAKGLRGPEQPVTGLRQSGLQRVASMSSPTEPDPQLKFGRVIGPASNPGADILSRSARSAEKLYEGYPTQFSQSTETGPSNDQINLNQYFDRQNKAKVADAAVANSGNKGWKVGNTIDPKTGQSVSIRYNEATGETAPLDLPGPLANKESPANIQKRIETENKNNQNRESQKLRAQQSLDLIKEMIDEQGNLKPDLQTATGWTANIPWLDKVPFGVGTSKATGDSKINQLQGQLTLDLIREMKEQSKTGATGFGALNLKELGVLENAASKLATRNMSEEEYAAEIGKIKDRLQLILQDTDSNQSVQMQQNNQNFSAPNAGRIRVRNKQTGQVGTISEGAFNSQKYDKVQ